MTWVLVVLISTTPGVYDKYALRPFKDQKTCETARFAHSTQYSLQGVPSHVECMRSDDPKYRKLITALKGVSV